jgi:hypothetical protein
MDADRLNGLSDGDDDADDRPIKKPRRQADNDEERRSVRREVRRRLAVARTSIKFARILAGRCQAAVLAALRFASENRGIDCTRMYTDSDVDRLSNQELALRPKSVDSKQPMPFPAADDDDEATVRPSTAFSDWFGSFSPPDVIRRNGWSAYDEREAMEKLLKIIVDAGGLDSYRLSKLADITTLLQTTATDVRMRGCVLLLAKKFCPNRLFADVILQNIDDRSVYSRNYALLFRRWQSNVGMAWPPTAKTKINGNLGHELAREISPNAPMFANNLTPLMAALRHGATGAVYGLLERHNDIDLLAVDDQDNGIVNYSNCCYWKIQQLISELYDRQQKRLQETLPESRRIIRSLLPAVLVPIVVGYLEPRPPQTTNGWQVRNAAINDAY